MKKTILFIAAAILSAAAARAEVKLPAIISDNMVLQQQTKVALWGTATPGKVVEITTTWSREKNYITADKDGKWMTRISTPKAGGPYEITFKEGTRTTIHNVLIGEVWFCSGQSNMEMPVKGFGGQPVKTSAETIMSAKPSTPIRMLTVKRNPSLTQLSECEAEWKEHDPEGVRNCSAAAYFFAKHVQETLGIPVGLVMSYWGGTPIQAWMNEETLSSQFKEVDLSFLKGSELPERAPYMACTLFNGMVAPLIPYTIKGMLWYQGESNISHPEQYRKLQPAYVQMMRDLFQDQNIPFYFVQIAPYRYADYTASSSPILQEAQRESMKDIPHSGMATTLDIGDLDCIHPSDKPEVGKRLAWLALAKDYGYDFINPDAPEYESVEFKDGKAIISFTKLGDQKLSSKYSDIAGFEIAGEDKVFYPAKAKLVDKYLRVEVKSDQVPEPVAVRYAFHNYAKATLFSGYGIPVGPFRTDRWAK